MDNSQTNTIKTTINVIAKTMPINSIDPTLAKDQHVALTLITHPTVRVNLLEVIIATARTNTKLVHWSLSYKTLQQVIKRPNSLYQDVTDEHAAWYYNDEQSIIHLFISDKHAITDVQLDLNSVAEHIDRVNNLVNRTIGPLTANSRLRAYIKELSAHYT